MKSFLIILVLLLLALSGCELFNNEEDIPDCVKQSQSDPSGMIYCFQPLYFGRPDWHPDGEWIAAEHSDSLDTNDDGIKDVYFSGIWLVDAHTGETQPLLPFGQTAEWNPQGTHLVVQEGGRIYTIQITSLEPARYDTASITLITDFDAPAFYPTWSEDGEWIAFDTNYNSENGGYVVWKIKKNGSELIRIGGGRQPNWSRTNSRISNVAGGLQGSGIFTMNADGSGAKQLTSNGESFFPAFSPDGEKIAYMHGDGINTSIHVINVDGGNKKTISKEWSTGIGWSPDGSKIAFVFSNQYEAVPGNGQLWIMDSDGKNKKQLTNFDGELPK
jgi:Tol biopolymer transport system component